LSLFFTLGAPRYGEEETGNRHDEDHENFILVSTLGMFVENTVQILLYLQDK